MYTKNKPPKPFKDSDCPKKFWTKDSIEEEIIIPDGFITDFLSYKRGTEVPSLFTIWGALVAISTVLKREVWLKWFPKNFFCNLFVILIGPPGSKKSTAVDDMFAVLKDFEKNEVFNNQPFMGALKKLKQIKNKCTPEMLIELMEPVEMRTFKDAEGKLLKDPKTKKVLKLPGTSETIIGAGELSALINKKKYNETMLELLMDFFDPQDSWDNATKGGGKKILKNLYTTFFAATTPEGFKQSVPVTAMGDGFLSRVILIYQSKTHRCFPFPKKVEGAPDYDELQKRLAWIACYNTGEYTFTADALKEYKRWYRQRKILHDKDPESGKYLIRITQHVLKVSVLLCAQKYERNKEVTLDDFKLARRLVQKSFIEMGKVVTDMTSSKYDKKKESIYSYIEAKGSVTRVELMRNRKLKSQECTDYISQLMAEGKITTVFNDKELSVPTGKTKEMYLVSDMENNEEGDFS